MGWDEEMAAALQGRRRRTFYVWRLCACCDRFLKDPREAGTPFCSWHEDSERASGLSVHVEEPEPPLGPQSEDASWEVGVGGEECERLGVGVLVREETGGQGPRSA